MTKSCGEIRAGIVGVNAERGWAHDAHIPALKHLPSFSITAVSSTSEESASAAAKAFGIANSYGNHEPLVRHPDVELVSVTVKVPYHYELVVSALEHGKAVYCEWPLAVDLAEAEELNRLALARGNYAAVGLQARSSPAIRHLRKIVRDGYVGKVLSTSMVASGLNWGSDVPAIYSYLLERRNGASMLTIPLGHAIDALCWTLGEFEELVATMATRRPNVTIIETHEKIKSDVADNIAISGILDGGAVASVHFRGGLAKGTNFLWEINGTKGDIIVQAKCGHIQMFPISISGARGEVAELTPIPIPEEIDSVLESRRQNNGEIWINVAHAYQQLATDWHDSRQELPNFADAVIRHRMLDAVATSATTGIRQRYIY